MGASYRHGNYCKVCETWCSDDDYCGDCEEHINVCDDCGEDFDMRDLADVFKHEHKGLPLDDVMGIKGEKQKEIPNGENKQHRGD